MDRHYFHAIPFLVASLLVCMAAVSMMGSVLWVTKEFREGAVPGGE